MTLSTNYLKMLNIEINPEYFYELLEEEGREDDSMEEEYEVTALNPIFKALNLEAYKLVEEGSEKAVFVKETNEFLEQAYFSENEDLILYEAMHFYKYRYLVSVFCKTHKGLEMVEELKKTIDSAPWLMEINEEELLAIR